ncbi:biotin carboxyl carrier domain-containing protein [Pseudonocardia sp. C8]|uniref:acetyl-CoA carboxylase n=1 Tax=Pseudonocardia sp. C8 TaxID=2762759 RepID=UPI001642EB6F|nr:acetyl-CoA carboxylase [Pseudonocardia sp. C8]MBC3190356.1 biotin carboxyl carrier domain-containing protein [Pseudonocardia sp. C8]
MARHEAVSPIPGVFYRKPDPASPDFVKPGQQVTATDQVGLVEVMKSFHPVEAGVDGTVVEYLAGHEAEVDAGEPVVAIEVDG